MDGHTVDQILVEGDAKYQYVETCDYDTIPDADIVADGFTQSSTLAYDDS